MVPAAFDALMREYFDAAMPAPKKDSLLFHLGLDPDDITDIVIRIERADGRKLSDEQLLAVNTYGDLKALACPAAVSP